MKRNPAINPALTALALAMIAAGCGASASDDAAVLPPTTEAQVVEVLSAADGAAARTRAAQYRPGQIRAEAATFELDVAASDADVSILPVCGSVEPYEPSPEELAEINADAEGLAAALDAAGIAYTLSTDDVGYVSVEYDWDDPAAQTAADDYWATVYPPEPMDPDDLARQIAENDVIAARLDAAGIAYTRSTGRDGWEMIEYNYEDPAAQAAVEAAYAELYPPQPPSAEEQAWMAEENDRISAALDAQGVPHKRVSDELGFEWIEWDFEDESLASKVEAAFDEIYGPVMVDDLPDEGPAVEPAVEPDVEIDEIAVELIECPEEASSEDR